MASTRIGIGVIAGPILLLGLTLLKEPMRGFVTPGEWHGVAVLGFIGGFKQFERNWLNSSGVRMSSENRIERSAQQSCGYPLRRSRFTKSRPPQLAASFICCPHPRRTHGRPEGPRD
jgi:hypothetical protein